MGGLTQVEYVWELSYSSKHFESPKKEIHSITIPGPGALSRCNESQIPPEGGSWNKQKKVETHGVAGVTQEGNGCPSTLRVRQTLCRK